MTPQSYSELLLDPRWKKKRLEIIKRDRFECSSCGRIFTQLNVHHKRYIYGVDPWDYNNEDLITLCVNCHREEHKIPLPDNVGRLVHVRKILSVIIGC